jgi:hypothetical protein
MKFASIAELRDSIVSAGHLDQNYAQRMIHEVPALPVVKDRATWLAQKTAGKVVLDIGCTGPISESIKKGARTYYGVDCVAVPGCEVLDIDHRPDQLPKYDDVELIVVAEVLEHLANPGYFLLALSEKYPSRELCITVPHAGGYSTYNGSEVVNAEHVAWYSYTTVKTLLKRYGYAIKEAAWYNGQPHKAEGLLFVAERVT